MASADSKGGGFDAATGILAVVLLLVAFFLPGAPPKASDSIDKITHFFVANRGSNLAADYVAGVGAIAFLWFVGSVRSYLRAAGESRISGVAFAGGISGILLVVCGLAVTNGLAFKAAGLADPAVVRALFDTSGSFFTLAGFGFAVFFGAVACSAARAKSLPAWLIWTGALLFLAEFGAALALFVKSGAFAGGGAVGLIVTLASLAWVLALSVVLTMRRGVPQSAA